MLLTVADLFARCQLYTCQQELPHMYVNTMFTYDHWLPHAQQSTNSWYSNNMHSFQAGSVILQMLVPQLPSGQQQSSPALSIL